MCTTSKLSKVVYFDEGSATDFIQIVHDGELKKTSELFSSESNNDNGSVKTESMIGIGAVFKGLIGARASVEADASFSSSLESGEVVKNIITNTLLTDFISIVNTEGDSSIEVFDGYEIKPISNSMSSFMLLTPYLSMLRGGSSIPAGDFAISLDRIDEAIKKAKGYYEFLAINKNKTSDMRLLRFNGMALKNNYKLNDLTKMNLHFYAVKVGQSSLSDLDIENELELTGVSGEGKNPDYPIDDSHTVVVDAKTNSDTTLDMYDVILAGVRSNG